MTSSDHDRARDLVLIRDVEGVSTSDALWLESHLAGCQDCASFDEQMQLTARALRGVPVTASTSLVIATQARIRARAAELRENEARMFLIGISFCLGLLWSAGSAFAGWKISAWLAERIHVAPGIIAAGLVVFWLAPAVAVAAAALLYRPISHHALPDWLATRAEGDFQ